MKKRFCGWALILILAGSQVGWARPQPAPEIGMTLPYPSSFVIRAGRENCWVKWNQEELEICVPRKHWIQTLNQGPPGTNAMARGVIQIRSSPRNLDTEPAKTARRIFRVRSWKASDGAGPKGWGSGYIYFFIYIEKIREKISSLLASADRTGSVRRLMLDERGHGDLHSHFRSLGFVHLLTSTGIHLYALAAMVQRFFYFLALWARVPVTVALWISTAVAWIIWGGAWVLCGARPGLLRPVLVVAMRTVALSLGVRWRSLAPLVLALSLDLGVALIRWVQDSQQPWAPGRWHYALAVGGGLLALDWVKARKKSNVWKEHVAMSVGSWYFTALLDLWHTQRLALATPVLSLLTIPLLASLAYPLLLLFCGLSLLIPGELMESGLKSLVEGMSLWIEFLFRATLSIATVWQAPRWSLLLACGLAGLSLGLSQSRVLIFAMILFLRTGSIFFTESINFEAAQIHQLDVGQGDAAWVRGATADQSGMIDVGSKWSLSSAQWMDLFSARGVSSLDWIVLTHLDEDHVGGLGKISAILPVKCVFLRSDHLQSDRGQELQMLLRERRIPIYTHPSGCIPRELEIFSVDAPNPRQKRNSKMTVLRIPLWGGGYYWNAGDSTVDMEERWIKKLDPGQRTNSIWKINHHGSKTSTSPLIFSILDPAQLWISSGVGNTYGHPTPEVLARVFMLSSSPLRRTDLEGYIEWKKE